MDNVDKLVRRILDEASAETLRRQPQMAFGISEIMLSRVRGYPVTNFELHKLTTIEASQIILNLCIRPTGFHSYEHEALIDQIVQSTLFDGIEHTLRFLRSTSQKTSATSPVAPGQEESRSEIRFFRVFIAQRMFYYQATGKSANPGSNTPIAGLRHCARMLAYYLRSKNEVRRRTGSELHDEVVLKRAIRILEPYTEENDNSPDYILTRALKRAGELLWQPPSTQPLTTYLRVIQGNWVSPMHKFRYR